MKGIRVAIWTTSEEKEARIECLKAGADGYVTEPAGYRELVSNMKRLVTRYTSQGTEDEKI